MPAIFRLVVKEYLLLMIELVIAGALQPNASIFHEPDTVFLTTDAVPVLRLLQHAYQRKNPLSCFFKFPRRVEFPILSIRRATRLRAFEISVLLNDACDLVQAPRSFGIHYLAEASISPVMLGWKRQ